MMMCRLCIALKLQSLDYGEVFFMWSEDLTHIPPSKTIKKGTNAGTVTFTKDSAIFEPNEIVTDAERQLIEATLNAGNPLRRGTSLQ